MPQLTLFFFHQEEALTGGLTLQRVNGFLSFRRGDRDLDDRICWTEMYNSPSIFEITTNDGWDPGINSGQIQSHTHRLRLQRRSHVVSIHTPYAVYAYRANTLSR